MLVFVVAAAAAADPGAAGTCTAAGQYDPAALRQICDLEAAWSRTVASGDSDVPARVLAEDYAGIGSSGRRMTKADMAAQPPRTAQFVSLFPAMIMSASRDTVRTKDGHVSHVWTDTCLKRGRTWQIVQSQDAEAEAEAPQ